MTYLESYRSAKNAEEVKEMAKNDAKVAIFLGNNPDRIKAIEDAMNQAINELEEQRTYYERYYPNTYDDEKSCENTTANWFFADGEMKEQSDG